MKYKVGEKVKIRTWENMKEEYGLDIYGNISNPNRTYVFIHCQEGILNKNYPDRILTIQKIDESSYRVKEIEGLVQNWMIECLAKDYVEPIPIKTRFEILDL